MPATSRSAATIVRVEQATGALATASLARMNEELAWFQAMPPDQRSWVGLVAQAGIAAFVEWLRSPDASYDITGEVFGAAPRELTRTVTLHQVVELVRITIEVVESRVAELAAPGDEQVLREAVLRYSREIAFAAADVYARAAEARGAWDARLEALVVDALLRGDDDGALASRAAALGWGSPASMSVLVGLPPDRDAQAVVDAVQRAARHIGCDILAGVHGNRLVAVLGGADQPLEAARTLLPEFAPGPVVLGPAVSDLSAASSSAQAALAGLRVAAAWPGAPRPVLADELLPERALDGDPLARRSLMEEIYSPLRDTGRALLETVSTYLEQGGSLEATARALFLHPNTVRYRLQKAAEVTGLAAGQARDAFTLQVALVVGRIDGPEQAL
ncbi:MAG: helix-turn-helix domain-containing protein [Actinomycetota bacterium]|nr:helix-turn-helix domain-containing protein [Actinomycetota bacterium]